MNSEKGNLTTAADMKREYQRKWYKEHPEKQKEYNRRYWLKKAKAAQAADASQEEGC